VDHRLWFPFQASPADEAAAKPFTCALNLQVRRPGAGAVPGAGAARLPVLVEPPLRWISPNVIGAAAPPPPLDRFVLRSADFRRRARLEARVDPAGGPVRVITGALRW